MRSNDDGRRNGSTAEMEDGGSIELREVQVSALDVQARSEIDLQIATAKRYPRSVRKFVSDSLEMATLNEEIAASCFYSLTRGGKTIEGPSARLAEIVASAWKNLHAETRIVSEDGRFITARAVVWDVESNVRIGFEVRRRITDSKNRTYSDDMIVVTANAASSIAFRNAVFKVVPSAFTQEIYKAARAVAIGNAETLASRRAKMIDYYLKMGVATDRLLAFLEVAGVEEISLDHLARLRGLATSIKEGDTTIEESFPEAGSARKSGGAAAAIERLAAEERSVGKAEPATVAAMAEAMSSESSDPLARARKIAAGFSVVLQDDPATKQIVGWARELPGKMSGGVDRVKVEALVRESAALAIVDAIEKGTPYPKPGEFPPVVSGSPSEPASEPLPSKPGRKSS